MNGDDGGINSRSELNRLLSSSKQKYCELRSLFGENPFSDVGDLRGDQRQEALALAYTLLCDMGRVDGLLTDHVLSAAPHEPPSSDFDFYTNNVKPNEGELLRLCGELLDLPGLDIAPQDRPKGSWGILNTFQLGMDLREMDQDPNSPDDDFRAAQSIMGAPFFNPDEWYRNAQELSPIFGEQAEKKIPWSPRERLRELYHSFILGNYLSAIAMARTILEYALIDRARTLGIDPNTTDKLGRPSTKGLGQLVREAASIRPDLEQRMDQILDFGNAIIHPKQKDTAFLFQEQNHKVALRVVNAIREVVLALYAP